MRRLAYGILGAFAALLAVSVYIAEKRYDGLVEENYYRKSVDYFRAREVGATAAPGGFAAFAGDQAVLLDIAPIPVRAMEELTFSVEAPGYGCDGSPWVDLGMEGMRMSPNRVDLERGSDGRYRGKGVLVRCPSGMRTWTATVNLPGKGAAVFTFDVAD